MKHLLFCLLMMMLVLEAKAQNNWYEPYKLERAIISSNCMQGRGQSLYGTNKPQPNCYSIYSFSIFLPKGATFTVDKLWIKNETMLSKSVIERNENFDDASYVLLYTDNNKKAYHVPYTLRKLSSP